MATVTIQDLPAATTPLTGAELVPLVQSGVTKQTALTNTLAQPYYAKTFAEDVAGVTPTYYTYPAGDVRRYGAVGNGTADDTVALQAAITACIQGGVEMFLPGTSSGAYKITTALSVTGKISIRGEGYGKTAIIAVGVNIFNISAGVSQIEMSGFRLNAAVRHTTTPNTLVAINVQGTTASSCQYHSYSDLFIDGFATPIQANGLRESSIFNVTTVFGKHGIIAEQQTVNNRVISCLFDGYSSATKGYGLKIGDGSSGTEGWFVDDCTLFGFDRGVWGYGSNNSMIQNSIIDFFYEYGVLLQSGASATASSWLIAENYMAGAGTASTGVRLLNNVAGTRGTRVHGNDVLYYSGIGATLSYAVLIDGTAETHNSIIGNHLNASTYDLRITNGTEHIVDDNHFLGGGFSATTRFRFGRNSGTILSDPNVFLKRYPYQNVRIGVTYSASMTPDLAEANHFTIVATNGTAFTINLPTNYGTSAEHFTITIRNTSGGALGVATWTTGYKMSTWTQPANGFARSITFAYNPATTYFEEVSRTTADVPN